MASQTPSKRTKVDSSNDSHRRESPGQDGFEFVPPMFGNTLHEPRFVNPIFPRGAELAFRPGSPVAHGDSAAEQRDSALPRLARNFVSEVPYGKFLDAARFVRENPKILSIASIDQLYGKAAIEALKDGSQRLAQNFVEKNLILHHLRSKSGDEVQPFLSQLLDETSRARRDFDRGSSTLMEYYSQKVDKTSKEQARNKVREERNTVQEELRSRVFEVGSIAANQLPHSARSSPPMVTAANRTSTRHAQAVSRHPGSNEYAAPMASSASAQTRKRAADSQLPQQISSSAVNMSYRDITDAGADHNIVNSPDASEVRHPSFYVFGRVFATLQLTDPPNLKGASSLQSTGGQLVQTHLRRVVVVKVMHGFCLALPISTYNGQGVSKRGLNQEDVNAHAIIYMSNTLPRELPNEPRMSKRAIEVIPADPARQLDRASRLNFRRLHSVDFNTRALDVGRVSPQSMPFLARYWREEIESWK